MKHLNKMLGLAAVTAAALMAFLGAGTASATELCKANESPCSSANMYPSGTAIHAVSEGHVVLVSSAWTAECNSTIELTTTNTGSFSETVDGNISKLEWTSCTNGCSATTLVGGTGSLEFHANGSGNGTVTGKNTTVTINCSGVACNFGTTATGIDLGALTGGNPATFDLFAFVAWKPNDSSTFVCTLNTDVGVWEGSYEVTSPKPLFVI